MGPVLKTKWLPYSMFHAKWARVGGGGAYQKALVSPLSLACQKALVSPLSLVLGVWNKKTTYWRLWSANILQVSNLSLDPCFKVM